MYTSPQVSRSRVLRSSPGRRLLFWIFVFWFGFGRSVFFVVRFGGGVGCSFVCWVFVLFFNFVFFAICLVFGGWSESVKLPNGMTCVIYGYEKQTYANYT